MLGPSNFSFLVASSWGVSSLNSTSFFSRVRRVDATFRKYDMKFPECLIMPNNLWSSFTEFGIDIFLIASILPGSTFTPSVICLRSSFTNLQKHFIEVLITFSILGVSTTGDILNIGGNSFLENFPSRITFVG